VFLRWLRIRVLCRDVVAHLKFRGFQSERSYSIATGDPDGPVPVAKGDYVVLLVGPPKGEWGMRLIKFLLGDKQ
jgi:hypothetical protein